MAGAAPVGLPLPHRDRPGARIGRSARGRLAALTPRRGSRQRPAAAIVAALLLAGCATTAAPSDADGDGLSGPLVVYTSVTQDTVDAVLAAYGEVAPEVEVEVFRAPTGELDARIAAERREGQIGADVLWGTDPLSVQSWAAQDLLAAWEPAEAASVPDEYQTGTMWGTRLLNMVIVHQAGMDDPPMDWPDLAEPPDADAVAIPDPGFAGSAFAMLGYFATADGYGMDYYRALAANGAVQVQGIPEVHTGVAEERFVAGMTLDKVVRDAIDAGAPIELAWPESGAIALYSPVAVFADASHRANAEHFANFLLTVPAQEAIASTGWQPIRPDVEAGPPIDGAQVSPDWAELFDRQEELLDEYRSIFGG